MTLLTSEQHQRVTFDTEQLLPEDSSDLGTITGHMARYVFASQFVLGNTCLDLACGMGYGSIHLKKRGAKVVVGGDASSAAVRAATTAHRVTDLHFARVDAQHLPFNNESFDVVVSMETIEHLPHPEQFLEECRRVLKPQGILVCSTPNRRIYTQKDPRKESPFNPFHMSPYHVRELDVMEFQSLVGGANLQFEAVYGQTFVDRNRLWKARTFAFWLARRVVLSLPQGQSLRRFGRRHLVKNPESAASDWFEQLDAMDEVGLSALAKNITPLPIGRDSREPANIIVVARKQ